MHLDARLASANRVAYFAVFVVAFRSGVAESVQPERPNPVQLGAPTIEMGDWMKRIRSQPMRAVDVDFFLVMRAYYPDLPKLVSSATATPFRSTGMERRMPKSGSHNADTET